MKLVKTHAYTTPGSIAPLVTPDECARLFTLPALAFKLFVCLVHVVDFKSGHGHTGYPELIAMLTPAQPERGRPVAVPTRDEVKHMLRRFDDMGLIARDKAASEARGNIIFHMQPRSWESVSSELAARVSARGASPQKADKHRAKPKPATTSRPGSRPHSHELDSLIPLPLEEPKLSTGTDEATDPAEGEKLGPPGGHTHAPDGARPPPEAQTDTGEGVRVGQQEGPPGGQTDAPAGHAPGGVLVNDPSTWQRDPQGRLILPTEHGGRHARPTARQAPQGGLRRVGLS
ncbi:hypothetical protein [Aquabacterium sp.]|uniref:hypothetical protein n=1 Tax=Aquabacterium sp. TaxID=1872578 RepID=UPI0025B91A23|nr:hypothetical protein [Aquabacterium sp.]